MVAEIDQKLQAEIAEWQKRMQEYLVEVAIQQQQQLVDQQQQSAQNGAQQPLQHEDHPEETEQDNPAIQPLVRSSSQQRE